MWNWLQRSSLFSSNHRSSCHQALLPVCSIEWQNQHECGVVVTTFELFNDLSDSLVKCLHCRFPTSCCHTYIYTKHILNLTWHEWHFDEFWVCFAKANNSAAFVQQQMGDIFLCCLCNWGSLKQQVDSSVLNKSGMFHPSFTLHVVMQMHVFEFIFPLLIYIVLIPYLPEGDHMLILGWK